MATISEATLGSRLARVIGTIRPGCNRAAAGGEVDARVAATALMLEVANADDHFTRPERGVVASTLREQFGVGGLEAECLLRTAETARATAPGLWTFTNVLVELLTAAQREVLTRILETLSEADGEVTWPEHYAIRKITALLRLEASHV